MTQVILFCITSCNTVSNTPVTTQPTNLLKAEKIMDEVDHGLYKVKLNDTTTILIYRGVESCTMLQLK